MATQLTRSSKSSARCAPPKKATSRSLSLEGVEVSPVVFLEGLTSNHYLERNADIVRYREALEYLRDHALSPTDSVELMIEVHKPHR